MFRSREQNRLFYELEEAEDLIKNQKDKIEELNNDLEKMKKISQERTIRLSTSRMDGGTPGRIFSNYENH
jgi:hypothetical protein